MNIEPLTVVIAIGIFILAYKLGMSFSGADKKSRQRIADLIDTEEDFMEVQDEFGAQKSQLAESLEGFVRPFRDVEKEESALKVRLMQAGWASPSAPAIYMFMATFGWVIAAVFGVFAYMLASKYDGAMFWVIAILSLFCCMMIAFGAQLVVANSIERRKKSLVRSFPDALDLLLVCVESGLALDAALARVCRELKYVHPEITKELNKTRLELTMLNDREKALQNLTKRTDLVAFKSLVAALLQSEKFGTSLVETLRVLSDDYRQTRMMLAEEKAGKLPAKIAVASIPFMLIALLILIVSPAIISISETASN